MTNILNKVITVSITLLFSCASNLNGKKSQQPLQLLPSTSSISNNHLFKIAIERKVKGASCTQGYLLVNGVVMAYTLELPDVNNQNYISSIPKGTYDAKIRTDGTKGWRIELLDVPNRGNVQIHVGNFTSEIEGCILIGTNVDLGNCNVTNTYRHEAMEKLQNKFNQFTQDLILNQGSASPINIEVEVSGI
jgi:hypothetical protein